MKERTGNQIPRPNRPEVIEAAKRDPFVSKVIGQQMQAHQQQVAGVVEKMRKLEPKLFKQCEGVTPGMYKRQRMG